MAIDVMISISNERDYASFMFQPARCGLDDGDDDARVHSVETFMRHYLRHSNHHSPSIPHSASKNTYKYSGLANVGKTVDVTSTDNCVTILKSSKAAGKLGATKISKNARRTNYAVGKEAQGVRPDLKRAAQAKASTLKRGLLIRKKNAAS